MATTTTISVVVAVETAATAKFPSVPTMLGTLHVLFIIVLISSKV